MSVFAVSSIVRVQTVVFCNRGSAATSQVYNHGAKTSDGRPQDEMAASVLASRTGCRSIVRTTARFVKSAAEGGGDGAAAEEEDTEGLVMEFLSPAEWQSLGGPPSFDSVTRDTYPPGTARTAAEIAAVARGLASACAALHAAGVIHGDLYAHNTLFRSAAVAVAAAAVLRTDRPTDRPGLGESTARADKPAAKLSDFGAAFFYPPGSAVGRELERTEARAYGVMLQEMVAAHDGVDAGDAGLTVAEVAAVAAQCVGPRSGRPSFADIAARVGEP